MIITREWIDTVAPEHGRTSCSDDNLANGYGGWNGKYNEDTGKKVVLSPRCTRCYLLSAEGESDEVLEFKVRVRVEFEFKG